MTLNKVTGQITLFSAAGAGGPTTFTVTNTTVAATDVIAICQSSGTDRYSVFASHVASGSFDITFIDDTGSLTEQPVFNFAVIKAANN